MVFKILNDDSDEKPVNNCQPLTNYLQAKTLIENFKGELSSITGIQSKGMYIAKLNSLTCEPETPSISIIDTHYIHINPNKVRYATGIYGGTWKKDIRFIPIEDNENEVQS